MQQTPLTLITFGVIIAIITILVVLICVFLLIHQKRQHTFLNDLQAVKNQYETELLTAQLELQEQTFQHIGREIHDNIGQYLSLVKLHLNLLAPELPAPASEKIYYVVDLASKAYHDLRDISRNLGAGIIREQGLCKAIEEQVDKLRKTNQYTVEFQTVGNYNYLEEEKEIILYRILQEAISNIIRHSGAKSVRIALDCARPGSVGLMIKDDGAGFALERTTNMPKERKVGGISHMSARARIIQADFSIQSSPGGGTEIYISVPQIEPYD